MLGERPLERGELVAREALDGGHGRAVRLDGEHRAALHEHAVEQDAAGAAAPRVAADVRARQVEIVAQEVDEEPARRHLLLDLLAVHGHGHELARRRLGRHVHPLARSAAWRTARTTEVSARLRR